MHACCSSKEVGLPRLGYTVLYLFTQAASLAWQIILMVNTMIKHKRTWVSTGKCAPLDKSLHKEDVVPIQ